jgi:hypothetical protein
MKTAPYLAFTLITLVLVGCQTVTSPFTRQPANYQGLPEEALREIALRIEQAVEAGEREPALEDRPELMLSTRVRQAIRTRATRVEMVDELRNRGFGIEKSSGLIAVLRSRAYNNATDRRQRDRDANVVMGENDDRWALYEGIIKDNGYPGSSRGAIQRIFFEARLQTLESGQFYESETGDPIAK